jgi:hypothetical protein
MELKKTKENIRCCRRTFQEKGYMGSSVRDLATKLNIKAAFYMHTSVQRRNSGMDLFWHCTGVFDELQEVKSTDISQRKLNLFIDKHLSVVLKNRDVTHIYSNEWKHLEERLPEFVELRKNYQQEVEKLISNLPG